MLIDAGEIMRDGGTADASTGMDGSTGGGGSNGTPGGGGSPNAQAHPVTCDLERVVTREHFSDGAVYFTEVRTTKYALVDVPDVQAVGIERCDQLGYDYGGVWGCPPGSPGSLEYTCAGQISKPCSFSWGAGSHLGNTVVVDCSTTSQTTTDGNTTTSQSGWQNVTLYY